MLVCLTISLTGILHLPLGTNKAYAAELNATRYLLKGQPAPFAGYLVEPKRLEKSLIALHDLESTKELLVLKTTYYEEKLKAERFAAEMEYKAAKAESDAVEKELKAKIADLDVWYKKPWFVGGAVAVIFIATGVLLP